jgi:hypothetical protein
MRLQGPLPCLSISLPVLARFKVLLRTWTLDLLVRHFYLRVEMGFLQGCSLAQIHVKFVSVIQ